MTAALQARAPSARVGRGRPRGTGKACWANSDCASGVCNGTCQASLCTDGLKNGTESDADCGDPAMMCPRCALRKRCGRSSSCASESCAVGNSTGFFRMECVQATCSNGVKDPDELDVDCGDLALACARCGTGQKCSVGLSCASGRCGPGNSTGVWRTECQAPACPDGVRNGAEVDVDCGDAALTCPRCAAGKACRQ